MELLIAIVLMALLLPSPKRTAAEGSVSYKEDAAIMFMGTVIGELRKSAETKSIRRIYIPDATIRIYKGTVLLKKIQLPSGSKLTMTGVTTLEIGAGPNWYYDIAGVPSANGRVYFHLGGVKQCEIMINFGTQAMDIR
ncbi:hypothetical protein [Youngiibacter fragilis]|uniref:Uncharacterized protein n=1 Tax=Youngiibacter fragilis 232.1 TaxID=994573 RepID=V7IC32_9CLOT|nr:hypothetical protein [Youngiibacter fragilis]ETA82432.1 hypothetical protein T472_0200985 [Youngiibacter fragilis 232.1]